MTFSPGFHRRANAEGCVQFCIGRTYFRYFADKPENSPLPITLSILSTNFQLSLPHRFSPN
jgi:hypothetical protein